MTSSAGADGQQAWPELSRSTLRDLERASGDLAASSVSEMERRLPWFPGRPQTIVPGQALAQRPRSGSGARQRGSATSQVARGGGNQGSLR